MQIRIIIKKEADMEPTRKRSKKRDAILSCLCSTDTHPSAEWIYHRLKPQIPDLSLATVYRNLALFQRRAASSPWVWCKTWTV